MAYICHTPLGSCPKCPHFRYDEDHGVFCCWAEYDLTHAIVGSEGDKEYKEEEVNYE